MKFKPYRIIGAYDSETTNIKIEGVEHAFPILHQLGLIDGTDLLEITHENVEEHVQVELYRKSYDLFSRLDAIVETVSDYVPVLLCHNLAFDMYGLSPWLDRHEVKVLAKSARKPITFTILGDDGKPRLVIWDTLIFSQQSLERMGKDCRYSKAVGEWDYNKIRTPQTPLTAQEIEYAQRDVYTLICWLCWWLRMNTDIDQNRLALNVVTKTGVVRQRRKVRFSKLRCHDMKRNVDYYWLTRCQLDEPKTDDELFTMLACTRGGFTFCSSVNASKPYDLVGTNKICAAFDATSQHPAQIVSHLYPHNFREMPKEVLNLAFKLISCLSFERVLGMWDKPFPVAFNACFEFTNLRPKPSSIFAKYGIFPLASARYKTPEQIKQDEDNADNSAYEGELMKRSYCDSVSGAKFAFGKIVEAQSARLYLTELAAWEICQAYTWDDVQAVHGYETGQFSKPSDIDVISVMQFYKAKNEFKAARKSYYNTKTISNDEKLKELGVSAVLIDEMKTGTALEQDIEAAYLGLKSDLNSIFGISCSNSYKRPTILTNNGIEYTGDFGLCNAPKTQRVWYQFGQRIVGWSRIAQICAMKLVEPYADTIINGDTDSIKVITDETNLPKIERSLNKLGKSIDAAKKSVCNRVSYGYRSHYDPLDGIGYYVTEFITKRFCASWNKAYCVQDENGFNFTLAGIPTKKHVTDNECFIGINGLADRLYKLGYSFEEICNVFLGYNVTYSHDVIRMNERKFPEWADVFTEHVTDYTGKNYLVCEPESLALYPMSKTINDTRSTENAINMRYALQNNPSVNTEQLIVYSGGILDFEGII